MSDEVDLQQILDNRLRAIEFALGSHPELFEQVKAGAEFIAQASGTPHHDALVVLGTGLADALEDWGPPRARWKLSDIPGVNRPVADFHRDEARSYLMRGKRILVYLGRTHLYEGHGPQAVALPAQIAALTGVRLAILTNANGCLRNWRLGDVMTITDHVNLTYTSPFDGPIFVDTTGLWDPMWPRT